MGFGVQDFKFKVSGVGFRVDDPTADDENPAWPHVPKS